VKKQNFAKLLEILNNIVL